MNVCIFCGSSSGNNPIYSKAASQLGKALAKSNCTLVYGGGNIGLMGILADEVVANGGHVIGVIPDFLMHKELGHQGIGQLEIVTSMHERKKRMADLSEAFIAMPGGWGTLEELAEILTWQQLSLISKPIGILNVNKYFDPLLLQMNKMVTEGFLRKDHLEKLIVENIPQTLLTRLGITHP
jgi:hypothetical protein